MPVITTHNIATTANNTQTDAGVIETEGRGGKVGIICLHYNRKKEKIEKWNNKKMENCAGGNNLFILLFSTICC